MIIKRERLAANGRKEIDWLANVTSAHLSAETPPVLTAERYDPVEELSSTTYIRVQRGEGVYVCSDDGRTVDIVSRLTEREAR